MTKRRASSTLISPATAGTAAARPTSNATPRNIGPLNPRETRGFSQPASVIPDFSSPSSPRIGDKSSTCLPDLDYDPAAHLAFEDALARRGHIGEGNFGRHSGQFLAVQVRFQPFPRFFSLRQRAHHRVDAVKTLPAQNE